MTVVKPLARIKASRNSQIVTGSIKREMPGGEAMRTNFFMVDNRVFDFRLPPIALCIYFYLCKCMNREHGCYPSKKTIAESLAVSVSSVSKYIQALSNHGLIRIRHNFRDGRQTNNSYELVDLRVAPPCLTNG